MRTQSTFPSNEIKSRMVNTSNNIETEKLKEKCVNGLINQETYDKVINLVTDNHSKKGKALVAINMLLELKENNNPKSINIIIDLLTSHIVKNLPDNTKYTYKDIDDIRAQLKTLIEIKLNDETFEKLQIFITSQLGVSLNLVNISLLLKLVKHKNFEKHAEKIFQVLNAVISEKKSSNTLQKLNKVLDKPLFEECAENAFEFISKEFENTTIEKKLNLLIKVFSETNYNYDLQDDTLKKSIDKHKIKNVQTLLSTACDLALDQFTLTSIIFKAYSEASSSKESSSSQSKSFKAIMAQHQKALIENQQDTLALCEAFKNSMLQVRIDQVLYKLDQRTQHTSENNANELEDDNSKIYLRQEFYKLLRHYDQSANGSIRSDAIYEILDSSIIILDELCSPDALPNAKDSYISISNYLQAANLTLSIVGNNAVLLTRALNALNAAADHAYQLGNHYRALNHADNALTIAYITLASAAAIIVAAALMAAFVMFLPLPAILLLAVPYIWQDADESKPYQDTSRFTLPSALTLKTNGPKKRMSGHLNNLTNGMDKLKSTLDSTSPSIRPKIGFFSNAVNNIRLHRNQSQEEIFVFKPFEVRR